MNTVSALVKREFLDHKGAMMWSQLVIGVLLLIAILWGAASVSVIEKNWKNIRFDDDATLEEHGSQAKEPDGAVISRNTRKLADGREEVTVIVRDRNGKEISRTVVNRAPGASGTDPARGVIINGGGFDSPREALQSLNDMPAKDRVDGAHMLASTLFAGTSTIPLLVALVMIPFILLASLFDERQDRSILFWKSLPVSDTRVVLSKLAVGPALTFAIALGISIIVHLVALSAAAMVGARYGVVGVGALWHVPTLLSTWLTWALVVFQYVLWALPVYAWFLLVSAAAPRAPFLFAFMVPAAVALLEGLWNKSGHFAEEFFGRLIGGPMIDAIEALSVTSGKLRAPGDFLGIAQKAVLDGFGDASLWVGLAVAALLLYAAIEIRRRKTL